MTDLDSTVPMTDDDEPSALAWQDHTAASDEAPSESFASDESSSEPVATDDIAAASPRSRGRAGLWVAAVLPVVLQAVAGALLLRFLLDDADAVAESTRLLGAVGLGALVVAALIVLFVGRRPPAATPLDPALAAIDDGEAEAARAAARAAEGERDGLRQRVGLLEATLDDAARTVRSASRSSADTDPVAAGNDLAESAGQVVAEARAAASAAHAVLDHAAAAGTTSSGGGAGTGSAEIVSAVERLETLAAETRLLALNAAIEASGVGEEGARFAVVADEVRKFSEDARETTRRLGVLVRALGDGDGAARAPDAALADAARAAARAADTVVELAEAHAGAAARSTGRGVGAFGHDGAMLDQLADRLDHVLAAASPVSTS